MADIVRFSPNDFVVPNRVLEYLKSVNTPDYSGNILINPNVNNIINTPIKYWKYYNNTIIEMNQEEKNAIDNNLKLEEIPIKKYLIKEYNSNKNLIKETWYEVDNGNETYSLKSEETEYIYVNRILNSRVFKVYNYSGNIVNIENWNYYTNSSNKIIEKKVG
jgi:hypothetical protein